MLLIVMEEEFCSVELVIVMVLCFVWNFFMEKWKDLGRVGNKEVCGRF